MSDFYCTNCGTKGIPIIRKNHKKREQGHLKKLYCCCCQQETNHAEVCGYGYTYDEFLKEFNYGHFVNGQRISFFDMEECTNADCNFYYHGRCWDMNNKKCNNRKR